MTERTIRRADASPPNLIGLAALTGVFSALFAGCSSGDVITAGPGKSVEQAVARAKPGDVITLAAGTYEGGIRLPAGVGLRGAGYRETTIVAPRGSFGVKIEGGKDAEVSDLSIRGGSNGLEVKDASGTIVRRVRVSEATNGIQFLQVDSGRIENVICDRNRYGVIVARGRGVVVVNCTLVESGSMALSLASGSGHAAFNNCVVGQASGVFVGSADGVTLDHNLYYTIFVGKLREESGRRSLNDWKYLSGLDAHSVEISVKYRDRAAGDYRPTGTLSWSEERAATSDWGVAKLGGFDAPDRDIDGQPRAGRFDVGVYEIAPKPSRPADGSLVVRSDAGIKSAGIFDAQGREVAYLFHNLPLAAGEYPYWFPVRDYLGRAIPAGSYEVRSVEADHHWEYLGWVGDTGEASPPSHTAPGGLYQVVFDDAGRLFGFQGWSEDATNVRCFDAKTGKITWTLPGAAVFGGCSLGSDGSLYFGYVADKGWDLVRIDPATGRVLPDAKGRLKVPLEVGKDVRGLAELEGRLFLADTPANKVRVGPSDGSRLAVRDRHSRARRAPSPIPRRASSGSSARVRRSSRWGRTDRWSRSVTFLPSPRRPWRRATAGWRSPRGRRGSCACSNCPTRRRRPRPAGPSVAETARSARTCRTASPSSRRPARRTSARALRSGRRASSQCWTTTACSSSTARAATCGARSAYSAMARRRRSAIPCACTTRTVAGRCC